ncbi:hypothetical protein [Blastococcus capsensis]|uniref:hypothetical protein n=1 Tax=Blastococcus capsensis TaxID=1564163 RepID=UPI00253FDED9|nr:hypothetical protein [Blastococcus capsensis]MDK3256924.1 hypothetical protein [Blastococcus capsensis]
MFLLGLAVPAFLVVLVGYVVGHALWTWIGGLVDAAAGSSPASGAEVAGWLTGALLLVGVLATTWAVRRRAGHPRAGGPAPDVPEG